MKLYLISLYYKKNIITGANKRFEEIIKNLLKLNIDFKIIVSEGEIPDFLSEDYAIELKNYNRFNSYYLLEKELFKIKTKSIIINDFMPIPLLSYKINPNIILYQLIHDIRNFTDFNRAKSKTFGKLFQLIEWKLAGKIITVSEFSKNQINKYIKIDKKNIIVSYNGIDKSIFFNKNINRDIDLLYIATFEKRKNHLNLIRALSFLPKNLKIVFVGRDLGYLELIKKEINKYNLKNIKIYESIGSEENLANLYNRTKVFVSPSLYEGFGMPLIEAFFCGCKICCSNIEVFKEIGRDYFIYFDPNNVEDIKNKIILSLELNTSLKNNKSDLLKTFDWENITRQLLIDIRKNIK